MVDQAVACGSERAAGRLHVAGLSLRTLPSRVAAVQDAICRLRGVEIRAVTADGRMVLTVETDDESDIGAAMAAIDRFNGVISLGLAFHQVVDLP